MEVPAMNTPRRDEEITARVCSVNLHTHTCLCGHADGHVDDYLEAAREAGLKCVGISDHTPLPDGSWPDNRMKMSQLQEYVRAIRAGGGKYPDMKVLAGLECEYFREYDSYYRDCLLHEIGLDYLVGGMHYFPFQGLRKGAFGGIVDSRTLHSYTEHMIESIQRGPFLFIAHPDLFANSYLEWNAEAEACSREIARAARSVGKPLEINGYGMRKPRVDTAQGSRWSYPHLKFWEIAAEEGVRCVINSDAHRPCDVAASLRGGAEIALELGLEIEFFPALTGLGD